MMETNKNMTRAADPFGAAAALAKLGQAWMNCFPELLERVRTLNSKVQETLLNEMQRVGATLDAHKSEAGLPDGDILSLVRELSGMARRSHAVYSGWLRQLIEDAPDVEETDRRRSAFWIDQLLNALAPANYFWTNPGAVQRYLTSGGKSLESGIRNWVDDVVQGDNLMRLVDESAFRLGENIAATPGSVVFRNELVELIQYHSTAETGFKQPIVMIQPWINKYYIFDLSAHNSFVRYLVGRGFPVFITSWRNPDETLRHLTFEDYLFKGLLPAIDVANEICGSPVAHATGYCIGGTALAALMAWFNSDPGSAHTVPVATWTLFSSLTDFSDPGMLGVFTGEEGIETVEQLAEQDGYLDSRYIRTAFRLLNSDGLIWRYVANNYLFGQMPPKSDLLYWDSDGTRLPQAMCSGYLRDFYLSNRLIRPREMVLGGRPLDLGTISQPAWIVGAEQDHISSWKGTFKTCRYLRCPTTYVLANEGHITGIVSPPSPQSRKKFWAGVADGISDPDTWRSHRKTRQGSWWPGWVKWLSKHSKSGAEPPPVGNRRFPVLGPAPGTYVLQK